MGADRGGATREAADAADADIEDATGAEAADLGGGRCGAANGSSGGGVDTP